MKILAYILLGGSLGFIILAIIVSLFAGGVDDLERERDYYKAKWLEVKNYVLTHKRESGLKIDEKELTLEEIEDILGEKYE